MAVQDRNHLDARLQLSIVDHVWESIDLNPPDILVDKAVEFRHRRNSCERLFHFVSKRGT